MRDFSHENKFPFKTALNKYNWIEVLQCEDVDAVNSTFQNTFFSLFNICFPEKNNKLNRGNHKMQEFMTTGLLISRNKKLELGKIAGANLYSRK